MRNRAMDEKDKQLNNDQNASAEGQMPEAGSDEGQFGVQHLLAPDEETLERLQKEGMYHFSQKELEHKEDRIEQPEQNDTRE